MREVVKKSAVPLYVVAACWLIYAALFPLYKISHFIGAIVVSLIFYFIFSKIFRGRKVMVEDRPERTGDRDIDDMIAGGYRQIAEMRRLNLLIKDEKISAQIDELEKITRKIFDYVAKHPKKVSEIKRFMNYYLPTTVKLLDSYNIMSEQGVRGKNIDQTMAQIKSIMDTIVKAFASQLDRLFSDQALDISSDIAVLEGMLAQQGLGGSDFGKK